MAAVKHRVNDAALARMMAGGGVRQDMARRGQQVVTVARALVGVDSGRLRADIHAELFPYRGSTGVRVGSRLAYARAHHDGTGIYGPTGQPIRPTRGKYLVFTPKGGTRPVFARQVRGSRGTQFLRRALRAGSR